MQSYNIFTDEVEKLQNSKADFLLITILPVNFCSFEEAMQTQEYLYSPLLITNAVNNLTPFSQVEILNLPVENGHTKDAQEIFSKGMQYGRNYELKGGYLILSQSSQGVLESSLKLLDFLKKDSEFSTFEKLSHHCDATLIFCAGFLLEASRRFHILLGGSIEMAACLYIADLLREDLLMRLNSQNVTFATNYLDLQKQNILNILENLSYKPNAIYTKFTIESSEIEELKEIEKKNEHGSAGAQAALAYGTMHDITKEEIVNEMELIVYML